jgi:hypothetical protein
MKMRAETDSAGKALMLLHAITELIRANDECERDCIMRLDGSLETLDKGISDAAVGGGKN